MDLLALEILVTHITHEISDEQTEDKLKDPENHQKG